MGIEGRTGEVLLTAAGGRLHGGVLSGVLKNAIAKSPPTAIGQVLFEQHDLHNWTIWLRAGPGYGDNIAGELIDGVRAIFGEACRVTVKLVAEIPPKPSGKSRLYRAAAADS